MEIDTLTAQLEKNKKIYEEKLNKLKKEFDGKAEKFDKKVKTSSFYKNKIKELE